MRGNNGGQRRWVGFDGVEIDPTLGTTTATGLFSDVIQNAGGNHAAWLLAATSPTAAPSTGNAVLTIQDAGLSIGAGKDLRLYNAAGSNAVIFSHSGTDDVALLNDTLRIVNALNVGPSTQTVTAGFASIQGGLSVGATYLGPTAGDIFGTGNLGFRSGTANLLTFDHAASAARTITVPDATDTMALLTETQTLANKTLSNGGGVAPFAVGSAVLVTNLNADLLDGATATVTPTADAIPIADGSGKIANGWLNTGSGGGLDADTLDTLDSTAFARLGFANGGNLIFTDNTYDLGAAGATRPRTGYFGTALHVGAPTTGAVAGEIRFGTAAGATGQMYASASGAFVGSLSGLNFYLLTGGTAKAKINASTGAFEPGADASYDLGASGASWRRLYLDSGGTSASQPVIYAEATASNLFQVMESGIAFLGDSANTKMTVGLTLNQGASDDELLAVKSSDVAHGMTDIAETDTYGTLQKFDASTGGFRIMGLTEDVVAIGFNGMATNEDTARSTSAIGHVQVSAWTKSGTSVAAPGANANLFVVRSGTSARFLVDQEGDVHYDAGTNSNAWDDHDDVALLEALRVVTGNPTDYRRRFSDDVERHAEVLAATGVLTLNPDGRHFISTKGLNGLLIDSIRQLRGLVDDQAARIDTLTDRLRALEAA